MCVGNLDFGSVDFGILDFLILGIFHWDLVHNTHVGTCVFSRKLKIEKAISDQYNGRRFVLMV